MRLTLAVAAAMALVAAIAAPTAAAQAVGSATVVPLQITGPPAERLNLVVWATATRRTSSMSSAPTSTAT
jgi:hypothetical protein